MKFRSISSKPRESWIFKGVKCDKHSSLVFSICDAYLYKVKARRDRTAYRSRHGTDNYSALVKASKNKVNPATDEVRVENAGFQNRGVCLQAFPSFPSPSPSFTFWLSFHFSRGQNRKSPSSVFRCSETKRKSLLRGLHCYWTVLPAEILMYELCCLYSDHSTL